MKHFVFTVNRETGRIAIKYVYEESEIDLAVIEYKRQLNLFSKDIIAGLAHVNMVTNIDGDLTV